MRLIDADALDEKLDALAKKYAEQGRFEAAKDYSFVQTVLLCAPTVKAYTAHEVAEILAEEYGDLCACNYNGNDEWLPEKCELLSACPYPAGVACWEQFLKYRGQRLERRTFGGKTD